ncbi:AAA family ATPase (plasmid) [Xanthomonas citri pv. citri]|uniref:AAA family ATPase n=1 Tax=Xanthomonas citri TaxID=346 RepID=UPI0019338D53|nr:AAA family ATPase [Xanthomonas citri]QRD62752.1 AAA family ATPase [Xanthomonas citri pv. citri]QRD67079.1 AAA family ATPase [Xanthomonas citri pv. citri]QRD71668.1 AAA family ATPase [Xanthomonas citri pv. citri]
MYNTNLDTLLIPAAADPFQDHNQQVAGKLEYRVAMASTDMIGLHALGANETVAGVGTKGHPYLAPVNPYFHFDNPDFDRLFTMAVNREWERDESEPRRGLLVSGDSGTGKTTHIRQRFAYQGIPCIEVTMRPDMEPTDLLYTREIVGGDTIVSYGAGALAAKHGIPMIINEIDAAKPSTLLGLNEFFDSGSIVINETGEVITAKRGFQVFATCNSKFLDDPTDAFTGTRGQNVSVLRRFFSMVYDSPTVQQEQEFIQNLYPDVNADVALKKAQFVVAVRAAGKEPTQVNGRSVQLSRTFCRSMVIDWLDLEGRFEYLARQGISPARFALGPVLTNLLPDHEKSAVNAIFDQVLV